MISHAHSTIFVHIPKTGGQSVLHVFLGLHGLTWEERAPLLLGHNRDPAMGPKSLAHLKASEYVSCGHIDQQTFDRYFKFSFVRNPWDRVVSSWHFSKDGEKAGIPFRRFVKRLRDSRSGGALDPQTDFLFDSNGRCLVDFIGRFESLNEDFAKVCDRLGLGAQSLPRVNAAPERKPYREYYNPKTHELVAALFREDIERFGYTFS